MRIFFSFEFIGGIAFLGMKGESVLMDTQVVDFNGLVNFLELRLGLHSVSKSDADRLVAYHKSVSKYMSSHKDDPDNQLNKSFQVSPLATSIELLKWRDALVACGWTQNTLAPSKRLKVLQEVEKLFDSQKYGDICIRQQKIISRLEEKKGLMKDVTFVLPYDVDLLSPMLKKIFSLAVADGASVEKIDYPEINGDNNLSKLKRLFIDNNAQTIDFDSNDKSVRIWNFKNNMQSEEYLAMLDDNAFDVIIQQDTKLTDNYLRMMGKPVTGSTVANSAPQIIQLFFTGVALFARPLNIIVLMQWLYAPISPIPDRLRYHLARCLAKKGGWCDKESDERSVSCYQIVNDWIYGKADFEEQNGTDQKEIDRRKNVVDVFLPDFDGGIEDSVSVDKLHIFLMNMISWAKRQLSFDTDNMQVAQLGRLIDLCSILIDLTSDYKSSDNIKYSEIEKLISCLYQPSEFVQYNPQASSRLTISHPGQIIANADNVLWTDLHDYKPKSSDIDFLTPSEIESLKDHIQIWDTNDIRKIQQITLLMPLMFCQKQIMFVTLDSAGNKHPLIVRIEQQIKNHKQFTETPVISDDQYETITPMTDNSLNGDGLYANIKRTDLITWKEKESPTSIGELIQNPIDYVLEHIANISNNGESDLNNLSLVKGNVAHAVIQYLFLTDDPKSGYYDEIVKRVDSDYEKVFNDVVETKGAILLLQENIIERRQLYQRLYECINNLLDIIKSDNLHVVRCEMPLDGNTLGENPKMHGYADMVLARDNGKQVIFDFKWTESYKYYVGLLQENRSSQLAIYANLLEEMSDDSEIQTAYFLMPDGKLYSAFDFKSNYATKIKVNDGCDGDVIPKIKKSYEYRRNEIISGKIEMGESKPVSLLNYFNDIEQKNLFPLKSMDIDKIPCKTVNGFSNYSQLKK